MVKVEPGQADPHTSTPSGNDAVARLLLPLEDRYTSPELIRRYWADFGLGEVDVLQGCSEIERLVAEPQALAPLLRQVESALLGNEAFMRFVDSARHGGGRHTEPTATSAQVLVDRGLNYSCLLNAVTKHLEGNPAVLEALLGGRIAEILFRGIEYQDFFEEAKCKGVYWGLHLFDGLPAATVCRDSIAWLLQANILIAVVSEGVGRRDADAGDQNASTGYLLAERLAEEGVQAISESWRALYHSWNAAFITNSSAQNMDAAKITASALLLPALFEADAPTEWVHRRAISLLFVMLSTCRPESSLNLWSGALDSAPVDARTVNAWGEANHDAAHAAALAGSHERAANLNDMTRLTRQARAMNRLLSELRTYDSLVTGTPEERSRTAREIAGRWREIAASVGMW